MPLIADLKVLLSIDDKLSEVLEKVSGEMDKAGKAFQDKFGTIAHTSGLALTAIGGAITGLAALSVKAAMDEQIGIKQLDQALRNVSTTYEANKMAIEGVIAAQERKTNYSDGQQRDALRGLIAITGDYDTSLKALPIAIDLAAGKNIDLSTASSLVGRALAGNTDMLGRYGIEIRKGADATEVMTALTDKFGGSAMAAANPITILKNQVANTSETFGAALIPVLMEVTKVLSGVVAKFSQFAAEHPTLTKVLVLSAAAFGAIAVVVGPILLALPALISGFAALGVIITVATGPVGIIVLAIAALTAAAIYLYTNWDSIWPKIQSVAVTAINAVIDIVNIFTFQIRMMAVGILEGVKVAIQWIPKLKDATDGIQTSIDALKGGIPDLKIGIDKAAASTKVLADSFDIGKTSGDQFSESLGRVATAAGTLEKAFGPVKATYLEIAEAATRNAKAIEDAAQSAFKAEEEIALKNFELLKTRIADEFKVKEEAAKKLEDAAKIASDKAEAAAKIAADKLEAANKLATENDLSRLKFNRDEVQKTLDLELKRYDVLENQASAIVRQGQLQDMVNKGQYSQLEEYNRLKREQLIKAMPTIVSGLQAAALAGPEAYAEMVASVNASMAAHAAAGTVPAMASGGLVTHGGMALVGERGPELVSLPRGAQVTPNGASGGSLNVTIDLSGATIMGIQDLDQYINRSVKEAITRGGYYGVFK